MVKKFALEEHSGSLFQLSFLLAFQEIIEMPGTVVFKMYLTAISFRSISQDVPKVSKHVSCHKEAL